MQKRYLPKGSRLGVSLVIAGLLTACASTGTSPNISGTPQAELDQIVAQAVLNPTKANVTRYMQLQQAGQNLSNITAQSDKALSLTNPDLTVPAMASTLTPAQQAEVASIVQNTLMNNPQILVDAVNKLHQQQLAVAQQAAKSIIAKNAAALIQNPLSPSIGPSNAQTVVIEFMDYQCSYCHQDYPVVKALIAAHPDIKVVFKQLPIFGESSKYAAKMALAAQQQGKFEAYHNALFDTGLMEGHLTTQDVDKVAAQVGIDLPKAHAWMDSSAVKQVLAENESLTTRLGIQGTPDFIVMPNSLNPDLTKITYLPGAVPSAVLENAIKQAQ